LVHYLKEAPMAGRSHTLVWIDAHDAIIVGHRGDEIILERIASDVPDHRRSTGHVRHDPSARHGGGGGAPLPAVEAQRQEHLTHYLRIVADRLPVADDLTILGPGTVREHLERALLDEDRHHHRERQVSTAPAERMTDRQLTARLNRESGVEPRRRTGGAYRWSGRPSTARSGRRDGLPTRVVDKPARPRDEEEVEA
jgi:hypothetical protein